MTRKQFDRITHRDIAFSGALASDGLARVRPDMSARVGHGSLTGRWEPRLEACPNIRGGITIERDIPAKTRLWLTGWTKSIAGGQFVSLLVEIADERGRPSR
jgi:hypothetical protein